MCVMQKEWLDLPGKMKAFLGRLFSALQDSSLGDHNFGEQAGHKDVAQALKLAGAGPGNDSNGLQATIYCCYYYEREH